MASIDWIGKAADVADICTLTVSGTWLATETATLTLNGNDLVVTAGTAVTTTNIATLIAAAVNATERLNDATSGYSNFGGQSVPEFAELIATSSGAVVTLTTRNTRDIGKPFQAYLTVADASTSGTLGAVTSVQAATGKNWWSNADNWSAGAVPVSDDTVNFRDTSVACLWGLPNASLEVTVNVYNSFTGQRGNVRAAIGLPKVNKDNAGLPYYEYRQRYVRLDDAGGGGTATHTIGIGAGAGPSLVNIRQATLATTFEVDCNGTALSDDTKVVNVIAPAGGTLKARKGTIDISDQDAVSASWTAITIACRRGQLSDVDVLSRGNASTAATVIQTGGRMSLDWATWSTNGLTLLGGETTVDTCGIPSASVAEGTLFNIGNGTIAALTLNKDGSLDVSRGAGTITITNANYHAACRVVNPGKRITHTNAIATFGQISEVTPGLDYGYNRTIQIAG